MLHNKMQYRKTFRYKIKMWFYRLTFRDIKAYAQIVLDFTFEIIIGILGFVLVFIIPAIFH